MPDLRRLMEKKYKCLKKSSYTRPVISKLQKAISILNFISNKYFNISYSIEELRVNIFCDPYQAFCLFVNR
jgi:hypothetical protein